MSGALQRVRSIGWLDILAVRELLVGDYCVCLQAHPSCCRLIVSFQIFVMCLMRPPSNTM